MTIAGWRGSLVVNGSELDVFDSPSCASDPEFGTVDDTPHPFEIGRYSWTIAGDTVTLTPINVDLCARRVVFTNTTYVRA